MKALDHSFPCPRRGVNGSRSIAQSRMVKDITLVGLLPPALQSFPVYGTAIPTYNATPDAALDFVKFISDPNKGDRWKAAGFELVGGP